MRLTPRAASAIAVLLPLAALAAGFLGGRTPRDWTSALSKGGKAFRGAGSEDPFERRMAALALRNAAPDDAFESLSVLWRAWRHDDDARVRAAALDSMRGLARRHIEVFVSELRRRKNARAEVQRVAVRMLLEVGPEARPQLLELLEEAAIAPEVRAEIEERIGRGH